MRVRSLSLLAALAALSAAGFAPVPKPKPKKAEEKKLSIKDLEGTWTVVSYEYRTARGVNTNILYDRIDVTDGKWVQKRMLNGREIRLTPYAIKIDARKAPHTFDMSLPNSKAASAARKGLFRLEGDRLTVTYTLGANPRPASIDGALAVSQYRWVLRRERR
jgi:uncharacterized protein (TIGR03067 family)